MCVLVCAIVLSAFHLHSRTLTTQLEPSAHVFVVYVLYMGI